MRTPVSNLFGRSKKLSTSNMKLTLAVLLVTLSVVFAMEKRHIFERCSSNSECDLEDVASATKSTTSAQTNLTKEICAQSGASSRADARTVWNARTSTTSTKGASRNPAAEMPNWTFRL